MAIDAEQVVGIPGQKRKIRYSIPWELICSNLNISITE